MRLWNNIPTTHPVQIISQVVQLQITTMQIRILTVRMNPNDQCWLWQCGECSDAFFWFCDERKDLEWFEGGFYDFSTWVICWVVFLLGSATFADFTSGILNPSSYLNTNTNTSSHVFWLGICHQWRWSRRQQTATSDPTSAKQCTPTRSSCKAASTEAQIRSIRRAIQELQPHL